MPDLWGEDTFFPDSVVVLRPQVMVLIEDGWVEEVGQPYYFNLDFSPKRHCCIHYVEIFMVVKPHPQRWSLSWLQSIG